MTSLTKLSLANRLIVGMVTVAIVIFGVLAAFSLRQELLPSTQVPTAIVTATYPGATPEIVAREVAKPLGQAISGVSGVTKVRAVSTNGLASLTVEWTYGLDNDELVDKIRTAGDALELPDGVEYDVLAGSTDDIPVLVLGVASDAPLDELAKQVDDVVVPALSGVEGVRQVQVAGQDTTELLITLKPDQLRKYDLTAAAVTQAVQSQAQVVPAGNSYDGDTELAIQVGKATDQCQAGRRLVDPGTGRTGQAGKDRRRGGPLGRGDHRGPLQRSSGPQHQRPQGEHGGRGRGLAHHP